MSNVSLGKLIRPAGRKAGGDIDLPVYSVTKHKGFVASLDYFRKQVFSRDVKGYKLVEPGDFAYATIHLDEGSIGICPERSLISPMYTVFEVDESRVDSSYLLRYLKSPRALTYYSVLGQGAVHRRKSISLASLGSIPVPLPPLHEQRRIAGILGQADAIRAKRREVLDCLGTLANHIFDDMFDDPNKLRTVNLAEIADVASGITKGRRTRGKTTSVPYLAVANVQAGHLALGEVKEIEATDVEVERYSLREGDLVLTEGGDPDKLGRGTIWRSELPLCLHQNHIFRVRPNRTAVLPTYLEHYTASWSARSYFLRAAKQTTGIASINKTQLKSLPVKLPPLEMQHEFAARVELVNNQRAVVQRALDADNELFAALQARAFRGDL